MRIIYDLFFILFSLAYIPYLLIKGKGHKGFFQKFGILPKNVTTIKKPVWIHAVSVGEAVLAVKLAESIKKKQKDIPVIISTTTSTGNSLARKAGKDAADLVFYYPIDISFIVSRVVKIIDPRVYVMVETELWPNLLETFRSRKVPIVLVNGRISDNSFKNYRMIKPIIKRILRCIDLLCMQTSQDAERIKKLGAREEDVRVSGNIKFDEYLPDGVSGIKRELLGFRENDKIIVAGSTHCPEEKELINIFKQLRSEHKDLKLIIAPRHIERTAEIKKDAEKHGFKYRLFSEMTGDPKNENADILIIDTIGRLKDIYSSADIVFIGGSIAKRGGQNPIEAARWGKPVIFGPNMFNFKEMSEIFLEHDAAICIKGTEDLKMTVSGLLSDPEKCSKISENARGVIRDNAGALDGTMELISKYLL
ncbi:MAG: 3-deoxy-D-manno-octulosonic acid transferase [Candidatus Omnitrophota bacterium]